MVKGPLGIIEYPIFPKIAIMPKLFDVSKRARARNLTKPERYVIIGKIIEMLGGLVSA